MWSTSSVYSDLGCSGPRSSNRRPVRSPLSLESWPRQLRALQWFAGSARGNGAFPGGTLWSRRPDFTTRRVPSSVTSSPRGAEIPFCLSSSPNPGKRSFTSGGRSKSHVQCCASGPDPVSCVLTLLCSHRAELVCLCPDSSSCSSKPSSDVLRFRTCLRSHRGCELQVK